MTSGNQLLVTSLHWRPALTSLEKQCCSSNTCELGVTARTSLSPGTANPTHNPFPLHPRGNLGRRWHEDSGRNSFPTCQCSALARLTSFWHTCAAARTVLPVYLLSSSFRSLPVLTATSFWSCAFLFSPSPLLSPSLRKLKIILPFLAARFPV